MCKELAQRGFDIYPVIDPPSRDQTKRVCWLHAKESPTPSIQGKKLWSIMTKTKMRTTITLFGIGIHW